MYMWPNDVLLSAWTSAIHIYKVVTHKHSPYKPHVDWVRRKKRAIISFFMCAFVCGTYDIILSRFHLSHALCANDIKLIRWPHTQTARDARCKRAHRTGKELLLLCVSHTPPHYPFPPCLSYAHCVWVCVSRIRYAMARSSGGFCGATLYIYEPWWLMVLCCATVWHRLCARGTPCLLLLNLSRELPGNWAI